MSISINISDARTTFEGGQLVFRILAFRSLVVILCLLWSHAALAVVYVDRDRPVGGNGTSWAQAYNSLDTALGNNLYAAQEFWIAEGTYFPAAPYILNQYQNHSFYGGFAGTETALSQRDVKTHPVIIDGQGSLGPIFYATTHVDTVRFDGLTIQGGAALGGKTTDSGVGAGIIANGLNSAVIANCTFKNNRANGLGGAVSVYNTASVLITGSTFITNTSAQSGGGAVSLFWDKTVARPAAVIEKSTFQGNQAAIDGGAVYSGYYPLTLRESTFIGNTSSSVAGALKLDYDHDGVDRIEQCLFLKNRVTGIGGGGAVQSYARSVVIENSVFAFNTTVDAGGGIHFHSGYDNAANFNPAYSVTITNSTFYGNLTTGWGGAISSVDVPMLYLYNSILWGNSAGNFFVAGEPTNDLASLSGSSVTSRYSDIQTLSWHHGSVTESHTGSFSEDPQFFDPDGADNVTGTADDNLSILSSSPCTDHADGTYAPATDIRLRPRTDNLTRQNVGIGSPDYVDVGAYEGPYYSLGPTPTVPKSLTPILHLLLSSP